MRALIAALLLAGCASDGDNPPATPGNVGVENQGEVPGLDDPTPPSNTSGQRRLALDELSATIAVVAGNDAAGQPITWTFGAGTTAVDATDFSAYGGLLGRPDWVTVTEEDGSPSALYVKFVRDMALQVCDKIVTADLARAAGEERTLWRFAPIDGSATEAQRLENAQYLVLRFLGVDAPEDDTLVASLLTLQAAATDPAEGWRSVCIALFEDPAFHLH
jgi:hypothetical protein